MGIADGFNLADYAFITLVGLIGIVFIERRKEKMDEETSNFLILLIFGGLAVIFDKWWIVFFSILFMYYGKKDKKWGGRLNETKWKRIRRVVNY